MTLEQNEHNLKRGRGMKKVVVLAVAGVFLASSFVFAEENKNSMTGKAGHRGMMKGDVKEEGMMMRTKMKSDKMGVCPIHGMVMGKMMERSLVATEDGGVIVLAGNKLYKYDKDLNLLKEAEIKFDMSEVQKMMTQMRAECPMSQKMSGHPMTDAAAETGKTLTPDSGATGR